MARRDIDAAFEMLDSRAATLGESLVRLSREWAGRSENELHSAISTVDRRERHLIGLVLARVILQKAALSGSPSRLRDFLFRFGLHLSASVGSAGGSADAVVVAMAARACLSAIPNSETQVAQLEEVLDRLPEVGQKREAWRRQLGVDSDVFRARLELVAGSVGAGKGRRPAAGVARQPEDAAPVPAGMAAIPGWLVCAPPVGENIDRDEVLASRSWAIAQEQGDRSPQEALRAAWLAFEKQDSAALAVHSKAVQVAAGRDWAPVASPEGLRCWNWLRFVSYLRDRMEDSRANQRRFTLSAIEAAARSLPEDDPSHDRLIEDLVSDFVTVDVRSRSAWAVYLARLVAAAGPDAALAHYDNSRRADLRQAWTEHFQGLVDGCHQTNQFTETLSTEYKHAVQSLRGLLRDPEAIHRSLTRPLRRLEPFLDDDERMIADDTLVAAAEVTQLLTRDPPSATGLTQGMEQQAILASRVGTSGSLLLQDGLGPAIQAMQGSLSARLTHMSNAARPAITVSLDTDRLPLSSASTESFKVEVAIRNDGNADARLVELRASSRALSLSPPLRVVERLAAGAEDRVVWEGQSKGPDNEAILVLEYEWGDDSDQRWQGQATLRAEDQRPTTWQHDDVNPFGLTTISEPVRLVGRNQELAALERTVAAGGSAYVTGQKRVGKTSLVKVLQRNLRTDGWITAYLPLGQALTANARSGDLILALLEAIYDESVKSDSELLLPEPPADSGDAGFARSVGRWLRQANEPIQANGTRVLVALDDFDTLPESLYRGPEADALFRTLRSIVDSEWLSLIFIGSEVLPTIIQGQAHQLNQVARFTLANFSNSSDTAELFRSRTHNRLDWDPRATTRAHYLCAGNPYYLSLLGSELWQHMRERDRSFVGIEDVNWSLARVAAMGDPSHFLHLWADDASGLDNESRRSLLGSAVLRAASRASGVNFQNAERAEVASLAKQWVPSATAQEWDEGMNSLVNRQVLVAAGSKIRLAIPLASAWLSDAGATELDRQYAAVQTARVAIEMISDREIVDLTADLVFCGERVSDLRLRSWLDQFETGKSRYLAFALARRLLAEGYFSPQRLTREVLPELTRQIQGSAAWRTRQKDSASRLNNVYILQHGPAGSSATTISATLLALLKIRKANLVSLQDFAKTAAKKPAILIVCDDIVGSGRQIRTVTEGLVETLEATAPGWRERMHLLIAAGVSAQPTIWIPEDAQAQAIVGHSADPRLLAFSPQADIFHDQAEREAAKDLLTDVGRHLEPAHPLGYGDLGLLAATEANCPNNVPAVFWKAGTYGGRPWLPLLARRV